MRLSLFLFLIVLLAIVEMVVAPKKRRHKLTTRNVIKGAEAARKVHDGVQHIRAERARRKQDRQDVK